MTLANHEASHCLTALVMGFRVDEVRIDGPEDGVRGWCELDRDERDLELGDLMVESATGLTSPDGASEYEDWPPSWPVLPGRGDQGQVRALVRALGIDEDTYRRTCELTEALVAEAEFRRLVLRISHALERVPVLSREDIEYLVGHDRIANWRNSGQAPAATGAEYAPSNLMSVYRPCDSIETRREQIRRWNLR